MELRRYLQLARRWLWLLILAMLAAAGVAFLYSSHQTKLYRASATLIINQGQKAAGTSYQDVLASQQLAKTYAEVATSRPVLGAAARSLNLGTDAALAGCSCLVVSRKSRLQIAADVPPGTQLIRVSAVNPDPLLAADGANAVSAAFSDAIRQSQLSDTDQAQQDLNGQIQSVQDSIKKTTSDIQAAAATGTASAQLSILQSQLSQEQTTYASLVGQLEQIKLDQARAINAVKVVEPASPPSAAFSPRTRVNVAVGAVLGLLAAAALVGLLEYLDDRVKSPADVERVAGAATLGTIERLDRRGARAEGVTDCLLLDVSGGFSPTQEAYRVLRSNLEFASAGRTLHSLVVTSARPGEGKTTTAANLAIALARSDRRVLLADGDLRRPSLHRLFQLPNSAGLSTLFLMDRPEATGVAVQTEYENLTVLPSGPLPPNPTELLSSSKMKQVLAALGAMTDILIIDSPPILALADASEIAARMDGVLLVVDTQRTRPAELSQARVALERASATVLGVVLNKLERSQARDGYYYSYSYSDYRRQTQGRGAVMARLRGRLPRWAQGLRRGAEQQPRASSRTARRRKET